VGLLVPRVEGEPAARGTGFPARSHTPNVTPAVTFGKRLQVSPARFAGRRLRRRARQPPGRAARVAAAARRPTPRSVRSLCPLVQFARSGNSRSSRPRRTSSGRPVIGPSPRRDRSTTDPRHQRARACPTTSPTTRAVTFSCFAFRLRSLAAQRSAENAGKLERDTGFEPWKFSSRNVPRRRMIHRENKPLIHATTSRASLLFQTAQNGKNWKPARACPSGTLARRPSCMERSTASREPC
jgi:hypothetical protein